MRYTARFLLLATAILLPLSAYADSNKLSPNTDLSPNEVVQIVITALKTHSDNSNDGIETVFRFASPGNKAVTGPIERFTQMIKRGFPDMLNHLQSEVSEIQVDGNTALQAVWLTTVTGSKHGYMFQLGKQAEGEFKGMWMTEAVMPLRTNAPQGQSI
jgi:hypothetical protein